MYLFILVIYSDDFTEDGETEGEDLAMDVFVIVRGRNDFEVDQYFDIV